MEFAGWPELLVVDVESNGRTPPDLVEVAALPIRDGRPDPTTAGAWLIRPPRTVTPRAARVHGLTDAVLAGHPAWDGVAEEVRVRLGTAWIAAHHAHVDHRVLSAHLPGWRPDGVIDTLRLARTTLPGLPAYTLDHLIDHLHLDLSAAPAQRHRATYDAYAAARLLLALAGNYPTWPALVAAAVPPGLPGAPGPRQDPTLW